MAFRYKNLMIHVLPEGGEDVAFGAGGGNCPAPTLLGCPVGTFCPGGSCGFVSPCNFVTPCGFPTPCGTPTICKVPSQGCGFVSPCPVHTIECGVPTLCLAPTIDCKFPSKQCLLGSCGLPSVIPCAYHSIPCAGGTCGITDTPCIGSWEPTTFLRQTSPVIERAGLQELSELKAQLNELEKMVAARVETVKAGSAPQTLAQIEALEKQMTDALAEIRTQKDQLKKKG